MKIKASNYIIVALGLVLGLNPVYAKASCPAPVLSTLEKTYPGSKVTSCSKEEEKGKTQYEVMVETKDNRKLEIDVSPLGKIIVEEEKVSKDSVPSVVFSAFEKKYPQMKPSQPMKQTNADGTISFELAFKEKRKTHWVTFSQDGKFIEEE